MLTALGRWAPALTHCLYFHVLRGHDMNIIFKVRFSSCLNNLNNLNPQSQGGQSSVWFSSIHLRQKCL